MFAKNKAVKYLIFNIIAFSFLIFMNIELFADPTDLLCNGIINPDGITNPELDDYTPFLSWTFYNSGTGDYQTAYQIRIGTTAGGSDIWLSAEIPSLTENCAYFGPQLNPNVTYHWSVRVRDQNSVMGTYSADATFKILDIGLRAYDGETVNISVDQITNATYALRIRKSGVTYGIRLTDPANSDASKLMIQTSSGIKSLKKMDVTTDVPPPAINGILMGIYNTAQNFTITGEAGATIEYSLNNGSTWLTYSSMVTLNTEGEYNVIARQTDTEGEMSAQTSPAIYIKIDLTAPDVLLTDNHAGSLVSDTDTVTITATFTEADEINEVTVPKITIGTVVTDADMTKVSNLVWTYTWNVPSGNDGIHNVSIAATDRAGNNNTAATGQTSYTIDNTPPTQPGTPTTTTPTIDTTPTWTWTASVDNGSGLRPTNTYQVFWDTVPGGETYSAFTNTNTYTHATGSGLLPNNTWYIKVKAFDNLNQESSFSGNGSVVIEPDPNTPIIAVGNVQTDAGAIPSDLKPTFWDGPGSPGEGSSTYPLAPVIIYKGITFWPFSYINNAVAVCLVGYDSNKVEVFRKNYNGARYIWQITVDTANKTLTIYGQASGTVTLPWSDLDDVMIPPPPNPGDPIAATGNVQTDAGSIPSDLKATFYDGPGSPSNANTTYPLAPVIICNDITYFPFSFIDNRVAIALVGYDSSNVQVFRSDYDGARYAWQITVDNINETITIYGQEAGQITFPWSDLSP